VRVKAGDRIVITDEGSDDFGVAAERVSPRIIDDRYPYQHRNPLWHLAAGLVYYVLLPPVAFVLAFVHGVRVRGRRHLREAGGCYLYGNHSNWFDVFLPMILAFPRRASIVSGAAALSIPFVRHLVPMLGAIPLNTTPDGKAAFRTALDVAVRRGCPVAIFPEAHEWPFYNGIRPFSSHSFTYPVRTDVPVVPYVVTYRRRWLSSRLKPHMTVTVGPAIPPSTWRDAPDPKQVVRDRVYDFMVTTVAEQGSFAWVEYVLPGDSLPASS